MDEMSRHIDITHFDEDLKDICDAGPLSESALLMLCLTQVSRDLQRLSRELKENREVYLACHADEVELTNALKRHEGT